MKADSRELHTLFDSPDGPGDPTRWDFGEPDGTAGEPTDA
jgi:hypothetical protein